MKSDWEIEQLLKTVSFQPDESAESAMLAEAGKLISSPMRRQWNWHRAAAIILASGAVITVIAAIFSRPEFSMADVKDALARQAWVHIKYDNNSESWICITDGRTFWKQPDGRLVYCEVNGLRLVYWPKGGQYISKDKWFVGDTPPPSPQSAWEAVLGDLPRASTRPDSDVERHADRIDGRAVVRFDTYWKSGWGNRILAEQFWADSSTHLPVREKDYLWLSRASDGNNGAPITGNYDFPTTGPGDIYDLGAPRDLPVVDYTLPTTPDVSRISHAADQSHRDFPARYRAVRSEPSQGVWVEYHDGEKFRIDRFNSVNLGMNRNFADTNQALAATAGMTADYSMLWDGRIGYLRSDPMLQGNPTIQMCPKFLFPTSVAIDELQWCYVEFGAVGSGTELLSPLPEGCPPGDIALRKTTADRREEYWIDPDKDYICVNHITSLQLKGNWMPEREDHLSKFARTQSGRWFASQRDLMDYGVPPNLRATPFSPGKSPMDVRELEEKDFPPGIFDPAPLIKGAKKID